MLNGRVVFQPERKKNKEIRPASDQCLPVPCFRFLSNGAKWPDADATSVFKGGAPGRQKGRHRHVQRDARSSALYQVPVVDRSRWLSPCRICPHHNSPPQHPPGTRAPRCAADARVPRPFVREKSSTGTINTSRYRNGHLHNPKVRTFRAWVPRRAIHPSEPFAYGLREPE